MTTNVSKWGNSLGVRLPKSVVNALRLQDGSKVSISSANGKIIIEPEVQNMTLEQLLEGMNPDGIMDQFTENEPMGQERFWENDQ